MAKCAGGRTPDCVSCLKGAGCDSTFVSCTGFTPPSLSLEATASCSDADADVYNNKGGFDNFESDMTACGLKCLGASSCVSSCMADKEGYSSSCAGCFGDLAGCTASNCMAKCAGGRTPDCVSCLKGAGCDSTFVSCSGFTPPSLSLEATASCSDADADVYNNKGGFDNFESDMTSCGLKCLGASSCVSSCMADKEGYSSSCAGCFGDLAGCTASNC